MFRMLPQTNQGGNKRGEGLKAKVIFTHHSASAEEQINYWLEKEGIQKISDFYFKFAFDRDNKPAMLFCFLYEDKKEPPKGNLPSQKRAKD